MWVTSALCVAASKIEQWTSDPAPELDVSVAHRQRHEVALAVGALAGVQQQPVPVERAELELDAQLLVDVVEPHHSPGPDDAVVRRSLVPGLWCGREGLFFTWPALMQDKTKILLRQHIGLLEADQMAVGALLN